MESRGGGRNASHAAGWYGQTEARRIHHIGIGSGLAWVQRRDSQTFRRWRRSSLLYVADGQSKEAVNWNQIYVADGQSKEAVNGNQFYVADKEANTIANWDQTYVAEEKPRGTADWNHSYAATSSGDLQANEGSGADTEVTGTSREGQSQPTLAAAAVEWLEAAKTPVTGEGSQPELALAEESNIREHQALNAFWALLRQAGYETWGDD